jgi:UDP-N-acetylmuramyl pentapeptide phosphotransferase/UDP-N-acetylglucosamine-1-phosphate transferase
LPDYLQLAGLSIVTAGASYGGVTALRLWAERRQILDVPNERSSHSRPTPRGGGLVIVILSTLGLAVAWLLSPIWHPAALLAYLAAAWLIAGVSWLDDLRSLPNRVRFAAHSLGAILAILAFGAWRVVSIPLIGPLDLGVLGLFITFIWIAGLTNAYNFMDGIDGIAGGQAVVAGLGWAFLGWRDNQPLVAALGLLLAATSLGFLGHNWPPARIFMGDVGSAFLGYTFAVLPVIAAQHNPRLAVAGVLLVWPFVFDAAFTFLRRLRHHENVFAAHRSHLYQRLVIAGHSHRTVTRLYIGLAATGAMLAARWYSDGSASDLAVILALPLLCVGLWRFVVGREHAAQKQPSPIDPFRNKPAA